jgi:iron complex outermembrane receptor protein
VDGPLKVVGAIIGLGVFALGNALAQNRSSSSAETAQVNPNGTAIAEAQRVIVTGSNIPTAEEVGANPVDTYRGEDITRLGARTPTELIQKIPAATGFSIGENNTNTFTLGTGGSTLVSLRGIDPKETLILQDGRRLADIGFAGTSVDFNVFPLGLIDHIDILKDGASPVYGSDAVTGVLNVYLIHRFRGLEVYASYGNTNLGFANDMGQETAYLLAGAGDEKTDIVVYAGVFNQAAIFSRDVNISHDADHTEWGGFDGRSGKFPGRVTSQVFKRLEPASSGLKLTIKSPTPHASANQFTDTQYTSLFSLPPERQLFNFADLTPNIAATDREFLYGSITGDICDKYLTIFADFKYFRQFWDGALAPAPFDEVWSDAAHPFGISGPLITSIPIQNAFNPFTVADYTSTGGFDPQFPQTAQSAAPAGTEFTTGVRYRALDVGPRTDKIQTENYLFTAGLKGNLSEFGNAWDKLKTWEWETAVRWNEDYRVERVGGVVNNNALRAALLDPNPATAFNPFGIKANSKAVLNRVFTTTHELGWTTLLTEDFKLSGDVVDLPGGPISFAIGTEHLSNHTSDEPDELRASGQTGGGVFGFKATHGSRDSWSEYWEFRIPITGPTWNFSGAHSLEIDYAERYESYSDFGETERPKFSVRWQPIDQALTLRAAYIEAFHAPTLGELFGGQGQFIGPKVGAGGENIALITEGNPTLKPEIAYEYTYGGVLTPGKWWSALLGLTLSVDLIHIDFRNYITQFDPQFVVDHEGKPFPTFVGTPGPLTETFIQRDSATGEIFLVNTPFQNAGRLILTSIDYEAVETFETLRLGHGDWGIFTATFNGTYNADVDLQAVPNGKRTTVVGKFGGGFQGTAGGGNYTHNRWYASLFYDGVSGTWMQGIDTGVVVHYIGQYWDNRDFTFDGNDRKVREWTTLDLIFSYKFNLPPPAAQTEVAGYARDSGVSGGKEKNVMPVSKAEYNPCGWRAWLNQTTLTLGVNNVFNSEPPFVAASSENGFDEASANAKGRFWYAAVKKRF